MQVCLPLYVLYSLYVKKNCYIRKSGCMCLCYPPLKGDQTCFNLMFSLTWEPWQQAPLWALQWELMGLSSAQADQVSQMTPSLSLLHPGALMPFVWSLTPAGTLGLALPACPPACVTLAILIPPSFFFLSPFCVEAYVCRALSKSTSFLSRLAMRDWEERKRKRKS